MTDEQTPLTPEEQIAIAEMNALERALFMDYLLGAYSSGPDYYEGWAKDHFESALFAGPNAFRDAFKSATKRRHE
jgi:hypothetical protein